MYCFLYPVLLGGLGGEQLNKKLKAERENIYLSVFLDLEEQKTPKHSKSNQHAKSGL